jgi:hypothetical protein
MSCARRGRSDKFQADGIDLKRGRINRPFGREIGMRQLGPPRGARSYLVCRYSIRESFCRSSTRQRWPSAKTDKTMRQSDLHNPSNLATSAPVKIFQKADHVVVTAGREPPLGQNVEHSYRNRNRRSDLTRVIARKLAQYEEAHAALPLWVHDRSADRNSVWDPEPPQLLERGFDLAAIGRVS